MIDTLINRPAFTLTVGELMVIIKEQLKAEPSQQIAPKELKPVRGIHGLAKFLGVSPVTAQKLKNSGKIKYSQFGRVILFDGDEVLRSMSENNQPKKKGVKS